MLQEIIKLNPQIPIWRSLQKIQGLGPTRASFLCESYGITKFTQAQDLPSSKVDQLDKQLSIWRKTPSLKGIENMLFQQRKEIIKRWIQINAYKGRRHKLRYPVRGQRTKSNANTARKFNRPL